MDPPRPGLPILSSPSTAAAQRKNTLHPPKPLSEATVCAVHIRFSGVPDPLSGPDLCWRCDITFLKCTHWGRLGGSVGQTSDS